MTEKWIQIVSPRPIAEAEACYLLWKTTHPEIAMTAREGDIRRDLIRDLDGKTLCRYMIKTTGRT